MSVCGLLGMRMGGRRFASSAGGFLVALILGSAVTALGVTFSVYWPLGILTPVFAGATCLLVGWFVFTRVLARRLAVDRKVPVTGRNRIAGAVFGATSGVIVAGSLWIAAALVEGLLTSNSEEPQSESALADPETSRGWVHALVKTANRGFVSHLPVLGPLGDEVEATVFILNSSERARRHVANGRDWQRLTELPTYIALNEDADVARDMVAFSEGSLMALYRLQRNPLVVAFIEEEQVQAMVVGLRPSLLAEEIREYEQTLGLRRSTPGSKQRSAPR